MRTARLVATTYGDQLVAVGVMVLFLVEVLLGNTAKGPQGWALLMAALMSASLSLRRTMPVVPLLAAVVVIQLSHTVVPGLTDGAAFLIALLVAIYSAGAYAQRRTLVLTAGLVAVIIPLAALDPNDPADVGAWAFFVVVVGAPFVAGLAFRRRRLRDHELIERARMAEVDSVRLAESAVAAERMRIARELHDVVAHAISVVVVQSRGGRRVLHPGNDQARMAFETIEQAGEQALVEMRRMLQVLRTGDGAEPHDLSPRPGLGRIDDLVADVTGAGFPVDVVVAGEPVELAPGVDLSAYRILQEALTNVIKHAGRTRVRILLRYHPDELEIEVTDDGEGNGPGGGSGHGLDGIRERVGVHGGKLHAGPRPEGGYVLHVVLPTGVGR